jgi:polysaccharide export outer membrane protein
MRKTRLLNKDPDKGEIMYSQGQGFGVRAIFFLVLLALLVAVVPGIYAQNEANSASVAKPVLPPGSSENASGAGATKDVANAAPLPAAPDTTPQRVVPAHSNSYVIGAEDVLAINVWKEPEMSKEVPVRPDGMISLPLLGEIKAQGLTPVQLEEAISTPLKKILSDPEVTVMVVQVHSLTFNIVGQINRPGYYPLTRRMTILDAIAMSGGMRDFAKQKKIYVLRTMADGKQVRLPFNYKNVIKGKNASQNIELEPRDTVVVP